MEGIISVRSSSVGAWRLRARFTSKFSSASLLIPSITPQVEIENLRTEIMPSNRKYPLAKILEAVKNYYDKTHRKIMFEYIMLKDVNDQIEHAEELAKILKGFNCMVNLIPYNLTYAKESAKEVQETQEAQNFSATTSATIPTTQTPFNPIPLFGQTSHNQIHRFKEILDQNGISAVQRFEFGQDIDAACGQLAAKGK